MTGSAPEGRTRNFRRSASRACASSTGSEGEKWLRASPARSGAIAALVHPGGYEAAMASLGYLAVLGELLDAGVPAHRILLRDGGRGEAARSLEEGRPLGSYRVLGVSVAYELEVPAVVAALVRAGIEPDPARRGPRDPLVVAGGALTLVNPRPLLWFADAVVVGGGLPAARALAGAMRRGRGRDETLDLLASVDGVLVARCGLPEDAVAAAHVAAVGRYTTGEGPVASPVIASGTAFGADTFLVEACRGCPRGCSYCVLRNGRCGPFVPYPVDAVVRALPPGIRRVGLVGAGISDHPDLAALLEALIERNTAVSTSSLRVLALGRGHLRLLARAGCRQLTLGVDGLSERLRRSLGKPIPGDRVVGLAEAARSCGIRAIKLYVMVGIPGEEARDLLEFAAMVRQVARLARTAVSAGPFVPKPLTPFGDAPMASERLLRERLASLRRALAPVARLDLASPRAAALEYAIARAGAGDRGLAGFRSAP